jgi:hypothetical protein
MAIRTSGIDHIHFNVRDLRKLLGIMNQLFDTDTTPISTLEPHGFYNATMTLAGADAGQPFLDLFQPASDDSEVGRILRDRGPGVSYISFRVEDLEMAAEHAAKCGLREVSRDGYRGMRQVQYDTVEQLGFQLEFVEYAPGFHEELEVIKRRMRAGETVDGLRYVEPQIS